MASGIYNRLKYNLMCGLLDLSSVSAADVIKVALLNDSHSFSAAHNTWSQVSANEISGTGYTAGGKILNNQSITQAATTKWDGDDVQWTSATFTAYHAVLFVNSLATFDLVASIDFGGAKSVSAGTFKIQWHTDGIITLAEA